MDFGCAAAAVVAGVVVAVVGGVCRQTPYGSNHLRIVAIVVVCMNLVHSHFYRFGSFALVDCILTTVATAAAASTLLDGKNEKYFGLLSIE